MTTPLGPNVTVQPIVIRQGATFRAVYFWVEDGVPQSLEGLSGRMGVARRAGKTPVTEVHTPDELSFEADGQVGRIDIVIPPMKTALITRNGYFDLVLIHEDPTIDVIRLIEGPVTLDPMTTSVVVPEL